jgi:hypothetical protein
MNQKKRQYLWWILLIAGLFLLTPLMAGAGGEVDTITKKIDNLYNLVIGIIKAAGLIVLAWGVFEFAVGYQAHDTAQQTTSLKRVIAGILMVSAETLINLTK